LRLTLNNEESRLARYEDAAVELVPLELLRPGEHAEVHEVGGEGSWIDRLGELGVRRGIRLKMLRSGSPCLLQIGSSRLSVRIDRAVQILVRPILCA
jgi:ferrous iron transport protein A